MRLDGHLAKVPIAFHVPADAQQSWHQLAAGSGSGSDVESVLYVLRKQWAVSPSDPRAMKLWLLERGINLDRLPSEEVSKEKRNFEKYVATMCRSTRDLIEGILSGPNVSQFFFGVRSCPAELKELAFRQALSNCRDERLVLVFIALSRESLEVIQSALKDMPLSSTGKNFCKYLRISEIASPPSSVQTEQRCTTPANDPLELLFSVVSLHPIEMANQISGMSHDQMNKLIQCATRVVDLASKDGYGQFLRYQLTAFFCIADPENPIGDGVIEHLENKKDDVDTDLLRFVGQVRAGKLLLGLISRRSPGRARLTASVLDVIRSRYPAVLSSLSEEHVAELLTSKNVPLALSAHAAALQAGHIPEPAFVQFFKKKAKSDKEGDCILWLTRNPEFLDYVGVDAIPSRSWNAALKNLGECEPVAVVRVLEKAFSHPTRRTDSRIWESVFKVLVRVRSESSDALFTSFTLGLLGENPDFAATILAREPALSLLWENIWRVCDRAKNEKTWNVIFNLVTPKTNETAVLTWLSELGNRGYELRNWLRSVLVPRLLADQSLSTNFLLHIQDSSLQLSMVNTLSSQTVEAVQNLQRFVRDWPVFRDTEKEKIASRASIGLRIAIRAAQGDPSLSSKLTEILQSVQEWKRADSPALEPSLASASRIELPEARAKSAELLSEFFSSQAKTPHETAYFFGVNPWATEMYFSSQVRSWPSPKLLLEQITKTFVHFARLRTRSETLRRELDEVVRIELAIVLRDALAEIEEMIAGYFAFRKIISQVGLEEADSNIGGVITREQLSSEQHKIIRDPVERGQQRVFGLGLKVGERVIGSARVMKSGDEDDRD